MRACENIYAVGDAIGMCRFTTKLFNSPSLPGLEEFQQQLANVTGLQFSLEELDRAGLNIMGVERLINYRLGVRRKDDTLPDRWFDEPNTGRAVQGGAHRSRRVRRHDVALLRDLGADRRRHPARAVAAGADAGRQPETC